MDNGTLTAVIAGISGVLGTGLGKWLEGRKAAPPQVVAADQITDTATQLVATLREELKEARAEVKSLRSEVEALRLTAEKLEASEKALRIEVSRLRKRIGTLEHELKLHGLPVPPDTDEAA